MEVLENKKNDYLNKILKPQFLNNNKEEGIKFLKRTLMPETIISRDWLLENINSPYYYPFFTYYPNPKELSAFLYRHFKEIGMEDNYEHHFRVKQFLIDIGYNFFKANIYKKLIKELIDLDYDFSDNEPFDLLTYKEAIEENNRLKTGLQKMDDYYEKNMLESRKENKLLSDENWELKGKLSDKTSELDLLKNQYFFYQDDLFKKYVFGDILPNLHGIYQLLKETKTFNGNWGSFCYCLSYSNAFESEAMKLELNLLNSDMTYKDLGLILFKLSKTYKYERDLPFTQWIYKIIKIKSKQGNIMESEGDMQTFIKKNFRPYKNTISRPHFYERIMIEFAKIN
ncbi:hypothetical protein LPB144_00755 [Christiangramia salexigens]|uniref:Uncharacterized protein n=1 Tax=Christiangramia salexigens TaxID=1913577 RepID=A0A1L3J1M2_9FLAO|nr:hypothetical protein LPB144_00755 [Christiangramia salexigens]